MEIRVTILGSGTSTGVPVIGCNCKVCSSADKKNKRLRASIMITRVDTGEHVVIDTSPDFRQQMLRENVNSLSKVLYTHTHADHTHGFDDLRAFFFHSREKMRCYLKKQDLDDLKSKFSYAFNDTGYIGVTPQVELIEIHEKPFKLWDDFVVEPLFLPHGSVTTTAFKFGRFAYVTDFKRFTERGLSDWTGNLDSIVISGLHFDDHKTHSTIPETIELVRQLEVGKAVITHTSHKIDYVSVSKDLPAGFDLAYDGMSFVVKI